MMKTHKRFKKLWLIGTLGVVLSVGGMTLTSITAQAADDTTSQTTDTHADQDQVDFTDPHLASIVADGLKLTTNTVTYGDIRHYQGTQPVLDGVRYTLTSLNGLQSLQELPAGIGVSLQFTLAKDTSLAPFSGLPVSGTFSVLQPGMHGEDLTPLNQLNVLDDPLKNQLRRVSVSGTAASRYANTQGLTDTEIQQLKPLFTQFAQHKNHQGPLVIMVTNQRLTDFSFFKQFGEISLLATGQYTVVQKPTYIDPATFSQDTTVRLPAMWKGLNGAPVQTSTRVYRNATGTLTMDGSDALVKDIDQFDASGQPTQYLVIDHQYKTENFPDLDPTYYPDGSDETIDGRIYYPLKWEKAPAESSSSSNTSSETTETSNNNSHTPTTSTSSATTVTSGGAADTVVPKGTVVYATKAIYLYQHPTFTVKGRQVKYAKQPRINRPMFVVTGYAQSKAGRQRYVVKDVNHHSKTAGKTGYVTANRHYTTPVYYQTKHTKVTVINPQGVNAYRKLSLSGKATHYRQGTVLKVVGLKTYHLTTRFKLSNGRYITANRKLVMSGKHAMPKTIRTKTRIHQYRTANLTGKKGTYTKGTRLKVTGWTYSHADNLKIFGALRYRVAGGYVTANAKYVQTIK